MNRVLNFSAGPSMLPLEVLEEAQRDLVDYKGCGSSVMEMSHRSKYFAPIIADAEASLRRIMNISDDYYVLFLQGRRVAPVLDDTDEPRKARGKGGICRHGAVRGQSA